MFFFKQFNKSYLILIAVIMISCNSPKRLYISNETGKPITLVIDRTYVCEGVMSTAFKDSLNGKHLEPGHITINFTPGKWTKAEEESLKSILANLSLIEEGTNEMFRLPKDIPVGRGIFIPELIVKINNYNK